MNGGFVSYNKFEIRTQRKKKKTESGVRVLVKTETETDENKEGSTRQTTDESDTSMELEGWEQT